MEEEEEEMEEGLMEQEGQLTGKPPDYTAEFHLCSSEIMESQKQE